MTNSEEEGARFLYKQNKAKGRVITPQVGVMWNKM